MSYNQRECFNNKEIEETLNDEKQHFNFKTLWYASVINGLLNVTWILSASQNKMVKKYTYEILLLEFDCPKYLVLLLSSDVFSEIIYETWFSWMKYFYWIKLVLLFRLWPDWYIPAQTIHFKDHSFSIPKLKSHQIYLRITELLHPSHFIKHHFYKSFTLKRPTSFIRISPSFANPPLLLDIHPLLTPQQLGTRE